MEAETNQSVDSSGFGRFKDFVNKHDRLMTVLGALIVFLGFFLKEDIREKSKTSEANLRNQQTIYAMQQSFSSLQAGIDRLDGDANPERYWPSVDTNSDMTTAWRFYFLIDRRLRDASVQLDYTDALIAELPSQNSPITAKSIQLRQTMDALSAEVANKANELGAPGAKVLDKSSLNPIYQQGQKDRFSGRLIAARIQELQEQVVKESERQRLAQAKRADRATFLSYCLFCAGWLLGLVGKIFKQAPFDDTDGV
jgi:hypothetical protein